MLPVLVAAHGVSPAAAVEGGEDGIRTFQKQKIKHKNKIAGLKDKARRKLNTNQIKSEDIAPATDTTRLHHCNA